MSLTLTILAAIASTGVTAMMLVLLLAGSPNSSPEQLAHIRMLMLLAAGVWLAGLVGAVWSHAVGRHGLAAGLGAAPTVFCIALFTYLFATSG
jgi:hypothetical protein